MILFLKLLFMLNLWLCATDLNNVKHVKKDRQWINAYDMLSNKSVGLVYDRRWKIIEW